MHTKNRASTSNHTTTMDTAIPITKAAGTALNAEWFIMETIIGFGVSLEIDLSGNAPALLLAAILQLLPVVMY